jgi:release factor glutamine methyltransferase
MTYKTLLEQTKIHFSDPTAAEFLIQSLTNKKRHELYLDSSAVPDELISKLNELLDSAKPDMPIQYLLHKAYFLSYELYVDERVLIPRFETEELVMKTVLRLNLQGVAVQNILDIGTGSGAIALALAGQFPQSKITATDISKGALAVAEININKYNLSHNIKLIQADLFTRPLHVREEFAGLSSKNKYDLIIANPPYVPHAEMENLSPAVKNYEPGIALDGGKEGFEIIKRIIVQAPAYLSHDGLLAMEVDPRQEKLIRGLVPDAQFEKDNQDFTRYTFIPHLFLRIYE